MRRQNHEDFYPENLAPYRLESSGRFPGKMSFWFMQIRHVKVDIDTYIRAYVRIKHFERSTGKIVSIYNSLNFLKISKHPTSNGIAKVRTLCEHRCKKVIVMCRKRPSTRWFVDVDVFEAQKSGQTWSLRVPEFVVDTSIGSHIWYLYSWMQFPWKSLNKKYPEKNSIANESFCW